MAETTMPVAEANVVPQSEPVVADDERNSYELAFHVLPTVTEGEVSGVFEGIKALITKAGGEIVLEEAPERIDLAYEIVKPVEGKNRRFGSAYFGWVRFKLEGEKIEKLSAEVDAEPQLLRYLIIKLTKLEEENPFRFHENRKSVKMVEVVNEDAEPLAKAPRETTEEHAEVSEAELDESLEKLTSDEEDGTEAKTEEGEQAEEKTEQEPNDAESKEGSKVVDDGESSEKKEAA